MCAYCDQGNPRKATTADHVDPFSISKNCSFENLVGCCDLCNQAKSTKTPLDILIDCVYELDLPQLNQRQNDVLTNLYDFSQLPYYIVVGFSKKQQPIYKTYAKRPNPKQMMPFKVKYMIKVKPKTT